MRCLFVLRLLSKVHVGCNKYSSTFGTLSSRAPHASVMNCVITLSLSRQFCSLRMLDKLLLWRGSLEKAVEHQVL